MEYYEVSPEDCLKYFVNPLDAQDHQDPPVIQNIEGIAEKDQEPEDDEPIASCTCSQVEPVSE